MECIGNEKGLDLGYTRKFLSARESAVLSSEIENKAVWCTGRLATALVRGRRFPIKRQHRAYGDPGTTYSFSGNVYTALPWSALPGLLRVRDKITAETGQSFNYCLVNRYADGRDCIGFHSDDEAGLDPTAPIASVSLGAARKFSFRSKERVDERYSLRLEDGSLLLMYPPTNRLWTHSLPPASRHVGLRINLTFRRVL